ncbi:MAG: hypothetical protein A2086_12740 [Spirochaetes bacterium GWD1_27_9]|nr:MAG: hypothetical protein A2Z98_17360 [Spirochaetes bacterium GWB1_27_13]OHD21282.1 MAG: hypothetical protein A2Y34_06350 [Spirochaetes bacterium GWC1_27_15]OHD33724.1 MAG: hypothetical protein A2086_12740 [Spirochaetes bacterium GWD1_27_9]
MAKILIVDDSTTMRESLNLVLLSAGHKVDQAINGVDGLNVFGKNKDYNLIITDINMPEMNGLDFIANLRKVSKDIPIIVLTTETEKEKIEIAKSYKASAWIVKPFKPADLLTVVTKVINTPK